MRSTVLATLAAGAVASPAGWPSKYGGNGISSIVSSLEKLLQGAETGPFGPVTSQIISDYLEPIEVCKLARAVSGPTLIP